MDLVDYPNALVDFPVCCADKYEAGLLDVEKLRYGENNKKSLSCFCTGQKEEIVL